MVKNPSWLFYKRGRGVGLGATKKQLQQAVRGGLEPGASEFQVRALNTQARCR